MNELPNRDAAIRRLTLAVWVLAAAVGLNVAVTVLSLFFTPMGGSFVGSVPMLPPEVEPFEKQGGDPATNSISTLNPRIQERFDGFHDWPIEKQVENASVIAVAKYVKAGPRYKAVISEILKKAPGTVFHYQVGDEYAHGGYYPKEGTSHGDGEIIFFTGTPTRMRYSCTFTGDRISAFGDMPFEELRKMIKKE